MAFLYRRGDRVEIRESRATPRGPRSRTLASFRGALSPDVLAQAAARASGRFDAEALRAQARAKGVAVSGRRSDRAARALLAELQRGEAPDPVLVSLLSGLLERLPSAPVPEHLAEAAEWVGRPEAERGRALRGLLRATDTIVRSRGPRRAPPAERFPRFASRAPGAG
jgi:hypothetical protein